MKNIGNALTRKLGPLPAWVWAIAAAALVYYYRNRLSSMSGTGTGSVGPAAVTPQPDTTLAPGESVYDPNTGSLLTSPVPPDTGGGGTVDTSGGGTDPSASIDALFNALAAAIPPAPVFDTSGSSGISDAPGPPNQTKPAQARPKVGTHIGKSIVAPYGAKKPPLKKGYRRVGKGHGEWLYVPIGKRKPKTKAGHTHTNPKSSGKAQHGRSKTSVRNRVGGRTTHRGGKPAGPTTHPRTHTSPASRRVSSRHKTTPVQAGPVKQRPVAKHPKPSVRPKPHPAPHHAAPPRHSAPRSRPKRKGY